MANKHLYDETSIESLDPLDFVRLKPGFFCGDTTYSTQLVIEVVSNAIDEFKLGHGSEIEVSIDGSTVRVKDQGQGFLVNSKREDGKTILEAAFSVLNTSGKYREDGVYEGNSLGTYGIGSKITNFLSHYCNVTTIRDGQKETVYFKEGVLDKREVGATKEPSGTCVEWQASEQFFDNPEPGVSKLKDLFETLACLCPGLTITLKNNGKKFTYFSTNGIDDLVNEAVKDKELIDRRFNVKWEEGKEKLDFVLTYTSNYTSTIVPYINTGLTEKGPHLTRIKSILTKEFNKFFREKKWLKDNEENLSGDDIQEGMYIVFNITAPNVVYDSQIKTTITKIDMENFSSVLTNALVVWFASNEKEVKIIADKALAARRARQAAKKARDKAREQTKRKEKVIKVDKKLADCFSKDRNRCEIYITEGDSASGNLKTARDNEFQAVLPVRGKILNVQKATLDKIQKNAEIMSMIDAFGLKVDTKTMRLTYDKDDLRYGKIIIMSDADVDGSHIKNLFYTFIWNFCPQLIIDGYVYAGVPPLYKITTSKGYGYLKNDNELTQYQLEHRGSKYTVNRLKGLGEMSAEETEETLVHPDTRILKQITVEDVEKANKLFDDLMGNAIIPRKEFIKKHSTESRI